MSNANNANPNVTRASPADFKFGKEIGHGSFSTVMIAKDLRNNKQYAAKVVHKSFIQRNKMISTVMVEKEALKIIDHQFIIDLICTFQDSERLYFILTYAEGSDILSHLNRLSCFDLKSSRFYAAEIIVALEYLHGKKIIHRDIKPENILLSNDMHIKICDFGSAFLIGRPELKAPSFTGTPQYVSPEMLGFGRKKSESNSDSNEDNSVSEETELINQNLAYLMDFWALGCIVYQFLSGRMPFHLRHSQHEYEIFQKIKRLEYEFPVCFDAVAKDFVTKLLVLNPSERLGNPSQGKHKALKTHPLFEGIDFVNIGSSKPPLLLPNTASVSDNDWDEVPVGYEAAWRFNIMKEFQGNDRVDDNKKRLQEQERSNPFHRFVRGRFILKQGLLYKRRGLFSQRRMFLLTEGEHLFYVDAEKMQLKGEIDVKSILNVELKSTKVFYIITKKRSYFLEDATGHADNWKQAIDSIITSISERNSDSVNSPSTSSEQRLGPSTSTTPGASSGLDP